MAAYDEKMDGLRKAAALAVERRDELPDSEWPNAEARERLDRVLAYARLVISNSDGALVSHSAGSNVEATLRELIDNPQPVVADTEAWTERLLDQLGRLPATRDRDFEQVAKDAAATFQRSAQQRFGNVAADVRALQQEIAGAREQLQTISDEAEAASNGRVSALSERVNELQTGFEGRLQQYAETLETAREEGLKQRGEQAEAFQTEQAERAAQSRQLVEGLETELKQRSEEAIAGLETSRERVASLVDLVTTSTTSEGFGGEANKQKEEADKWRRYAVAFGFIAVGIAAFAVVYALVVEAKTSIIIAKVAAAVAAAGLAGYAAKQSAEHREREVRARRIALELTAFGPFTEALRNEEKERDARMEFIERVFVGDQVLSDGSPAAALTSGDVSLLGQLVDVLRKSAK